MIWTKTSVSNTGAPCFSKIPQKKSPSKSTEPSSPGWAVVSWNARSRSSAWRPDGEIWFRGCWNRRQICQPEWGATKAPCVFFFRFKLCTRISLLGWILKEIMWLGWILKCVFGGISCDAWEACLRPDKCDMFHGRKLSCDIGGLCVGVIQTDWSPPEWWIAKPPAGS